MPDAPQAPLTLYRRIAPGKWDKESDRLRLSRDAFQPAWDADAECEALSTYDASICSPRQVLQKQIDLWTSWSNDPECEGHSRAKKQLAKFPTVEALVENRWGVATLNSQELDGFRLVPAPPGDPDPGHINIEHENSLVWEVLPGKWALDDNRIVDSKALLAIDPV